MTDKERFLFDLNGYLMLEDVLTGEEVAAANRGDRSPLSLAAGPAAWPGPYLERPQGLDRQGRVHARPLGL